MSTRTNLSPQAVIGSIDGNDSGISGDMSTNITSRPTILGSLSMGAYGIKWTGASPVGSISMQMSVDYKLNPNGTVENPGSWTTVPMTSGGTAMSVLPVTGNTGTGLIDVLGTGVRSVRLIYTAGSGTGTLTAQINAKVS